MNDNQETNTNKKEEEKEEEEETQMEEETASADNVGGGGSGKKRSGNDSDTSNNPTNKGKRGSSTRTKTQADMDPQALLEHKRKISRLSSQRYRQREQGLQATLQQQDVVFSERNEHLKNSNRALRAQIELVKQWKATRSVAAAAAATATVAPSSGLSIASTRTSSVAVALNGTLSACAPGRASFPAGDNRLVSGTANRAPSVRGAGNLKVPPGFGPADGKSAEFETRIASVARIIAASSFAPQTGNGLVDSIIATGAVSVSASTFPSGTGTGIGTGTRNGPVSAFTPFKSSENQVAFTPLCAVVPSLHNAGEQGSSAVGQGASAALTTHFGRFQPQVSCTTAQVLNTSTAASLAQILAEIRIRFPGASSTASTSTTAAQCTINEATKARAAAAAAAALLGGATWTQNGRFANPQDFFVLQQHLRQREERERMIAAAVASVSASTNASTRASINKTQEVIIRTLVARSLQGDEEATAGIALIDAFFRGMGRQSLTQPQGSETNISQRDQAPRASTGDCSNSNAAVAAPLLHRRQRFSSNQETHSGGAQLNDLFSMLLHSQQQQQQQQHGTTMRTTTTTTTTETVDGGSAAAAFVVRMKTPKKQGSEH